ncbi:hypothetical protein HDU96_003621 [Phlyctochytrium bullatum]|nr:hypothetical protein HDU96_003621 [Phlyctochytrium bullatum]
MSSLRPLKLIADFCVVPVGVGASVSAYVAECQRVLQASGLNYQMHLRFGTRTDKEQSMMEKITVVEKMLEPENVRTSSAPPSKSSN